MEEQKNVPQPTWWTHSCYTGIPWLSAVHCLSTVTIWCVFHVDYAALVPHTGVERHSAFRSRTQPAAVTQFFDLTLSGGPHSRCPYTDCVTVVCAFKHTTLPQQTPPRNSPSRSSCNCVLPNTPSGAQFHSVFMKTSVKHRPPATRETRWQPRSLMPPRSSLFPSSQSDASSPELSRRVPQPSPTLLLAAATQTPSHRALSRVRLLQRPFGSCGPTTDTWECQWRLTSPTQ